MKFSIWQKCEWTIKRKATQTVQTYSALVQKEERVGNLHTNANDASEEKKTTIQIWAVCVFIQDELGATVYVSTVLNKGLHARYEFNV